MQQPTEPHERLLEMEMDPALLQGDTREQWEAIADLDAFFSRVYDYFQGRGIRCILASRIISLLTLGFTIILTLFLVEMMNWNGLLNECVDELSCVHV